MSGAEASIAASTIYNEASSYRVKFRKEQFLELVDIAKPRIIYRRGKNHFFAFDGFVMYTQECQDEDFQNQKVVDSIELSSYGWQT